MRFKTFFFLIISALSYASISLAQAADVVEAYRLRQGDAVFVSVWGEETLLKEIRVLPDGSITFPLAGRIEVAGLTSPEVEKRIAEKLKEFLPEPQVTVVITNIEGNRAYILGKVLKPGPFLITGPMSVLQALSMAGGLDKFAQIDAIKVLRSTPDGPKVLSVHYDRLLQGQDLETNFPLLSGDTILVP